jgi:hypothetical protein
MSVTRYGRFNTGVIAPTTIQSHSHRPTAEPKQRSDYEAIDIDVGVVQDQSNQRSSVKSRLICMALRGSQGQVS